jgi:hypothetical protein
VSSVAHAVVQPSAEHMMPERTPFAGDMTMPASSLLAPQLHAKLLRDLKQVRINAAALKTLLDTVPPGQTIAAEGLVLVCAVRLCRSHAACSNGGCRSCMMCAEKCRSA